MKPDSKLDFPSSRNLSIYSESRTPVAVLTEKVSFPINVSVPAKRAQWLLIKTNTTGPF